MRKTLSTILPLLAVALLVMLLPTAVSAGTNKGEQAQVPTATPPARPTAAPAEPQNDWARVKAAGKIVFGTAADYPPFEFYNSQFELDGFDIALAKALGEELGLDVTFNDYAFDGLLNSVRLGEVDAAIGAISVTPDRQEVVDFTNLYYIGQSAAVASENFTTTIRSATDLSGVKIGVQRGTTYQAWAQQELVDKNVIAQEDLVAYPNVSAIIGDLRKGTVDVGLMGFLPAEQAQKRYPDLKVVGDKFHQQQFAIAIPQGSNLAVQLNQALLTLQSNGTFANLVKQYLQDDPANVTPDKEESIVTNVVVTPTVTAPTQVAPPCIDGMAYVADLNLDDHGMTTPPIMVPGQDFTKGWRVLNSGTCAWAPDFSLAYVQGNRIESSMGGSPVAVGRTVQPGEMADIMVNLRAPQTYGTFQGFWQMRNSLGQYFGEVIWVGIQVPDPNPPPAPPPPPVPTPAPSSNNPNLRADSNYINAGQCTTIRWDIDNVQAVYFIEGSSTQGVGGHEARTVCPTATTTYVLRVEYPGAGSVDYPITINVTSGGGDYSINFWADSTSIDAGQCTTLRWDVRNVQAVYLNGEGVAGVSQREVCPNSTATYTLLVTKYDGGQDSRQVTIEVRNAPPPSGRTPVIERFSVSANEVFRGSCVYFEWRTDDADAVNLLRNGSVLVGGGSGNGSSQDCPDVMGLYEYRLDAYNSAGQVSQTVMVNVLGPQPR